jgi:isoleucyl-tRNA synthetase
MGIYHGGPRKDFYRDFPTHSKNRFNEKPPKGESWRDLQKRILKFFENINERFKGKTILIISHGDPLWLLEGAVKNWSFEKLLKIKINRVNFIKVGELRKI